MVKIKCCGCISCLCCDGDNGQQTGHATGSVAIPAHSVASVYTAAYSTVPDSTVGPRNKRKCMPSVKPCKLHKRTIGISVFLGLIFSISSCIDCRFVLVDVGFEPDNAIYRSKEFGLGLWTMEDPTDSEKCLMIDMSRRIGSITKGDNYYSSSLLNGDSIWGAARIMAMIGLVFGVLDVIFIWKLMCSRDKSKDIRKERILYLSLLPFLCEGVKFGLFFNIDPCTYEIWEQDNNIIGNNQMVEVIELFEADNCYMGRSTYFSLLAFLCYLLLITFLTAAIVKPDYTHQVVRDLRGNESGGNVMAFDDVSMPSYLGSIGASITSRSTRNSGSDSVSAHSLISGVSGSTGNKVGQLESIVEEEKSSKLEEGSYISNSSSSLVRSLNDSQSEGMYSISMYSSGDTSSNS